MSALSTAISEMEAEAKWLDAAAKRAAKDGMYDTGAGFRNRASGIRRALEILEKLAPPASENPPGTSQAVS